jgi:repressor LexA
MNDLTKKQKQVLDCITAAIRDSGYPPSVRELGRLLGLSSPATVNSHLDRLEELGYIRRETGKRRSITLTDRCTRPEGIPILGTVAAGQPILAVEDAEGYLTYTPERAGEYFALRIKGDSMSRAGILDGDMVVVRSQDTADHGQIVIALLGDEATCKRLWRIGGRIMLMPENEAYQPIDGTGARILGRVTAVVRTYG